MQVTSQGGPPARHPAPPANSPGRCWRCMHFKCTAWYGASKRGAPPPRPRACLPHPERDRGACGTAPRPPLRPLPGPRHQPPPPTQPPVPSHEHRQPPCVPGPCVCGRPLQRLQPRGGEHAGGPHQPHLAQGGLGLGEGRGGAGGMEGTVVGKGGSGGVREVQEVDTSSNKVVAAVKGSIREMESECVVRAADCRGFSRSCDNVIACSGGQQL